MSKTDKPTARLMWHVHFRRRGTGWDGWCPIRWRWVQLSATRPEGRILELCFMSQKYKSWLITKQQAAVTVYGSNRYNSLPQGKKNYITNTVRTLFVNLKAVYGLPIRIEVVRSKGWRVRTELRRHQAIGERRDGRQKAKDS